MGDDETVPQQLTPPMPPLEPPAPAASPAAAWGSPFPGTAPALDWQVPPVRTPPPWGVTESGEFTRTGLLLATVLGFPAVLLACPFGITGVVLSSIGLTRARKGDPSAAGFMTASWILLGIGAAFALIGMAFVVLG